MATTITAADIQALGRKIGTMFNNRKNTVEGGLFTSGGSGNGKIILSNGVYSTSGTTSAGTSLDAATYNKTIGVIGTMGTTISTSVPASVTSGTSVLTETQYNAAVTWVNSFYNVAATATTSSYTTANKRTLSGCNGFCTGLCAGTCYGECQSGCKGSGGSAQGNAGGTYGPAGVMARSDGSSPVYSSDGSTGPGNSSCAGSCMTNCWSGCISGCTASCYNDCYGCGSTCYSGCYNACSGCSEWCGSGCSGCYGCDSTCYNGCYNGCQTSCKQGCTNSSK